MTAPNSVTQSQTAAAMLRAGDETDMLCYVLNQLTQTENRWPLPDGSCVIRHPETGCYEFVSPDGSSELQHASRPAFLPYASTGHLVWRILKRAEAEVSPGADDSDDPPLSEVEALSICPQLMAYVTDVLDKFELGDYVQEWLDQEAAYMTEDIRPQITRDQWQAIVAATKERISEAP